MVINVNSTLIQSDWCVTSSIPQSSKIVSKGFQNMNRVSQSLLSMMVPGESPHTLGVGTGSEATISKQSAQRTSDTSLSMGSSKVDMPQFCSLFPDRCSIDIDLDELVTSFMVITDVHTCFSLTTV